MPENPAKRAPMPSSCDFGGAKTKDAAEQTHPSDCGRSPLILDLIRSDIQF
jgi:hypothetical protein